MEIYCGPGGMVVLAKKIGIDGDFTISYPKDINVIIHDFAYGPLVVPKRDFSWSCEFLEHVKEKYMDNYFSVFRKTKIVCITFCNIYGTGIHHVNIKNQDYWDEKFKNYGFYKDKESTDYIRQNSSMNRNFVRNTGTVYRRKFLKKFFSCTS